MHPGSQRMASFAGKNICYTQNERIGSEPQALAEEHSPESAFSARVSAQNSHKRSLKVCTLKMNEVFIKGEYF
jgi:hypothetical protein